MAVDVMPRLRGFAESLPAYGADRDSKPRTISLEGADKLAYDDVVAEVGRLFQHVKAHGLGVPLLYLEPIAAKLKSFSDDFQYSKGERFIRWLGLSSDIQLFKKIADYSRKSL